MPRKKQTTTSKNCRKTKKRTGANPHKLPKGITLTQYYLLAQEILNLLFGLSKNSAVNQKLTDHLAKK